MLSTRMKITLHSNVDRFKVLKFELNFSVEIQLSPNIANFLSLFAMVFEWLPFCHFSFDVTEIPWEVCVS